MNIINNLSISVLEFREFYKPLKENYPAGAYSVPANRITATDPVFQRYSGFQNGYVAEFTLTTSADLRHIADNNLLVEVYLPEHNLQLGDESGFELTNILPPPAINSCLYVYKFKSVKPLREYYKPIKR